MGQGRGLRIGVMVIGLAVSGPVLGQQATVGTATSAATGVAGAASQVEPEYDAATAALDREEFDRAIEMFSEIANGRGERADAALYWIAYAQKRQGDVSGAMNTIGVLRREYPESAWLDDADYLVAEIRGARGEAEPVERADESEDMRLYALNALMNVKPERALPLLERMIRSDESLEIRQRALFILLQGHAEEGRELIAQIARDESDPELRLYALRSLGMYGDEEALSLMDSIYRESSDAEIKGAILSGYMMSGDTARLYEIARTEPDPDLRLAAIRQLAMAGDADQLWELYEGETAIETREAILQTMFATGDVARLLQVARTEPELRLRRAAIHGLGMAGVDDDREQGVDMSAELLDLYGANEDGEIREAILNALWMRGDSHSLIQLYEQTSDTAMRRHIVHALSMVNDEDAVEFLLRLIEQ